MNKLHLITISLATLVLAACSHDHADTAPAENIELRLTSAISTGTTRANYTSTQSTTLAAGETVYAWVYDSGAAAPGSGTEAVSEHVKAWKLSCDTEGALSGANKYYFPASGNTVNIYALHGNLTAVPVEGTTTWAAIQTATHNVLADQSTAGNYELSDLLYARNTTITRDNNVKTLNFKHQLAKIEIHIVCGNGMVAADLNGAKVKIKSVKPTATISLSKTADKGTVTVSGTATDILCRMQYSTEVDRNVGTAAAPDVRKAYAFAEAIVVPQWFSSDFTSAGAAKTFLQITLPSGIVLSNTLGPVEFEQGKKYEFNVTINTTDLNLKCDITDWTDGTTSPYNTSAD